MAGLFDFLGANQGTGMYDDLLTPEQRQRIQQQSMMNLGATLLAASGKSTEPVNVGQALGTAMLSSQKARTDAEQNALQGMLTKQKIQQYQKGLKTSDMINQALLGQGVPTTPQGALTAPVAVAGPVGPTAQRATMIGQPSAPQQTGGFDLSVLTPIQKMAIAGMTDPDKKVKALMDATAGASEYGAPTWVMMNGKPTQVQYNKFGQPRVVSSNALPYEPLPGDIRAVEYLLGNQLGGTGQPGMKSVGDYREQIRPKTFTENKIIMPTGGLTPVEEAMDKAVAQQLVDWQAGGGVSSSRNISDLKSVLGQIGSGQKISGPVQALFPDFIKSFTNPNSVQAQETVSRVVQNSMKEILGAQFTEKEGAQIISRAFNPSLPPEVNAKRVAALLEEISRQAENKAAMMKYVMKNRTLKGYEGPQVDAAAFVEAVNNRLRGITKSSGSVQSYFQD